MHKFNQGNLKVYRTGKCWFKFKGLGNFLWGGVGLGDFFSRETGHFWKRLNCGNYWVGQFCGVRAERFN